MEFLQRKLRSDNTSGYPGAYQCKNGKWRALIPSKQKRYFPGTFDDKEKAISSRKKAEVMHAEFQDDFYREYPEVKRVRRKEKDADG